MVTAVVATVGTATQTHSMPYTSITKEMTDQYGFVIFYYCLYTSKNSNNRSQLSVSDASGATCKRYPEQLY